MKTFLTGLILASALIAFITIDAGGDAISEIRSDLEDLKAFYASTGEKRGDALKKTAEIQRAIASYIRAADDNDWATPSRERIERLDRVAALLQDYQAVLIAMGTPSREVQGNSNARGLLYFASPGDELREGLHRLAGVENPRGAARHAYAILFNLELDTPAIRKEIVARISRWGGPTEDTGAEEVFLAAAQWRIPATVGVYLRAVETPGLAKDDLAMRVGLLAEAARGIGPAAKEAAPLLRQHLSRLEKEGGHRKDKEAIESALRAINGEEIAPPMLAISGRGVVKRPE